MNCSLRLSSIQMLFFFTIFLSVVFELAPDNVLTVKHKKCSRLRKHKKECALDFMRVKDVKLLHLSLSTRQR